MKQGEIKGEEKRQGETKQDKEQPEVIDGETVTKRDTERDRKRKVATTRERKQHEGRQEEERK